MSELPVNWIRMNIGQFAQRVKRKNSNQSCTNVLTISANEGLISQKEYFKKIVASKDTSGYTLLENGEFAYNKSYSDGFPVGAARRLRRYPDGIVSPLYICFCVDQELLNLKYADYLFDSQWFNSAIFSIAKEGARSHGLLNLGINEFFGASLPIPPLSEQKKITEILSGIDQYISLQEEKLSKSVNLSFVLADELLDSNEFEFASLSDIADLVRGKFSHRPRNDPAFYGGDYPFLQTGDIPKDELFISTHQQTLNDQGLSVSRLFPKGTLVMTIAATIAEVGILKYPSCFPDSLVGITAKSDRSITEYLFYIIRKSKERLKSFAPQSAQSNLNLEILNAFNVPVPSLGIQQKISEIMRSGSDNIALNNRYIHKLKILKKGLSDELLSGRKRVKV